MREKTSDHEVKKPKGLFAAVAVGASLAVINPSFAEEEVIEEQVVTGSRLQTTNETASQPIATISEQALSKSGQFDIGEVYCIAYLLVGGIFGGGYGMANTDSVLIGSLISLLLTLLYYPIQLGCQAVVYRELTSDLQS